jgi:hypothetical protein
VSKVITLTHYDLGPIRVAINEEHSWYLRRRVWSGVDTDGQTFEDGDFLEPEQTINCKLLVARASEIARGRAAESMALPDA